MSTRLFRNLSYRAPADRNVASRFESSTSTPISAAGVCSRVDIEPLHYEPGASFFDHRRSRRQALEVSAALAALNDSARRRFYMGPICRRGARLRDLKRRSSWWEHSRGRKDLQRCLATDRGVGAHVIATARRRIDDHHEASPLWQRCGRFAGSSAAAFAAVVLVIAARRDVGPRS